MASWTEDEFVRRGVVVTFLWLLAMFVGGVLLVRFGDVLQNAFA